VSGRVRRVRISVATCTSKSELCRDVFDEVGFLTGRVPRGRVNVGMISVKVGFVSGLVRRSRVSVGTCTTRFSSCRDVFGEVWFVSRLVERGRLFAGICSTRSD